MSPFLGILSFGATLYFCSVTFENSKMKVFLPVFLSFLLIAPALRAQTDTLSADSPISFEASYLGDAVSNFSGGIRRGGAYLGMANLKLLFSTEKASLWRGGLFFVNGANTHGGTPSVHLFGDFQVISNIEAGDHTYVHELWYRQELGSVALIVGLQDLNAEFVTSEYASLLINSSFGVHSTIADNIPSPIFPQTALGAQLQYSFSEMVSAKLALFDGLPEDLDSHPHNLEWKLNSHDGLLWVSEFAFSDLWKSVLFSEFKVGAYFHSHKEPAVSEEMASPVRHENWGIYLLADQMLYSGSRNNTLSAFLQASVSSESKNRNWYYLGAGLNYKGWLPSRLNDEWGLAVAHAGIRHHASGSETTLELTYKAYLCNNLFVQPDIQYVIQPAGTERVLPNVLAGILRIGFNF